MSPLENITVIFGPFAAEHVYKDVGMIPAYLKRLHGIEASIICFRSRENRALPDRFSDVRVIKVADFFNLFSRIHALHVLRDIPLFAYLARRSRRIRVLMLFHASASTIVSVAIYKMLHREGCVYIKLDMDRRTAGEYEYLETQSACPFREALRGRGVGGTVRIIIARIKRRALRRALTKTDLISVEAQEIFDLVRYSFLGVDVRGKVILLPNGMDDAGACACGLNVRSFDKKDDLIITAGRIGTDQKNNRHLLDVIEGIDLRSWQVCFIGPIERSFEKEICAFYERNPLLRDKVRFTGAIVDRARLYSWYDRAKVFCLTSRYEGFPLVYAEALYFGNFIVTTDVTGARDVTRSGTIGAIVPIDDVASLASELTLIISGSKDIGACHDGIIRHGRTGFLWSGLAGHLSGEIVKRVKD